MVGAASEIPGGGAAARAYGGGFRSRGKVPHAGERAVHALLSGADSAIPVSPRALPRGGDSRPLASLLDLWQQGGWQKVEPDASHGAKQALAGSARDAYRREANGRDGASGLFRAAEGLAGRTEPAERLSRGLVRRRLLANGDGQKPIGAFSP